MTVEMKFSTHPSDVFAKTLEARLEGKVKGWKFESWFSGGGIILPLAQHGEYTIMFQDQTNDEEPFGAALERWGDSGTDDDWGYAGCGWNLVPVVTLTDAENKLDFAEALVLAIDKNKWPWLLEPPKVAFGRRTNKSHRWPTRRIKVGQWLVEVSGF